MQSKDCEGCVLSRSGDGTSSTLYWPCALRESCALEGRAIVIKIDFLHAILCIHLML